MKTCPQCLNVTTPTVCPVCDGESTVPDHVQPLPNRNDWICFSCHDAAVRFVRFSVRGKPMEYSSCGREQCERNMLLNANGLPPESATKECYSHP
jgi:hypothetical protein